jgi:undecaprenyl-phosphate 4-deoxy-4-formamido-L-arabinose transferase
MTLDVTVVIPVYGGATTIEALADGLRAALGPRGWTHEILFVCDCPVDDSWAVVQRLSARWPQIRGILLRRNYGQHPATLLGIREARGRTIVTMDEDLQHDPRDVPALVTESLQHEAIVYGVSPQLHHGLFRNASSRTIKWFLAKYLDVENAQNLSAFRAFPAQSREAYADYHERHVALDVLLSWSALPVRTVTSSHAARKGGKSGYTLAKLLKYLGNLAFGFSTAPLRISSYLGVAAVLASFGISLYALVNWLMHGSTVPGFAFLALTVSGLGGVQLLVLGLIGEYLGRLYSSGLRRPQYTVAARVGGRLTEPEPVSTDITERTPTLPPETAAQS